MKDSFIFYRSFYEALTGMNKESQADCLMAIANYALNDVEPELTPEVRLFFTLVKPQIDANKKRYENGQKGGRPKKENNQTITKSKPNNNQEETKTEPNVNDNVNDNINDNVNLTSYGQFKNVLLTNDFYTQLINTHGIEKVNYGIEKLDSWLDKEKQKDKRNQNHRGYFKVNSWVWDGAPDIKLKRIDPPVSLDDLDFTR